MHSVENTESIFSHANSRGAFQDLAIFGVTAKIARIAFHLTLTSSPQGQESYTVTDTYLRTRRLNLELRAGQQGVAGRGVP